MKVLRFLYDNLRDKNRLFWTVFAVAIVDGAFVSATIFAFARISQTDMMTNESIIHIAITLLILTLGTSWFIRRYGETLALTTSETVRTNAIRKLTNAPLLTLQEHHSGYILSLVNRVADTLQPILFNLYWWGARSIVYSMVLFVAMFQQSVGIFLVDVVIVAIFVMLSQWLSIQILYFNKAVNHAKSNFMSIFADFAANITTVKRLHIQEYMQRKVHTEMNKVVDTVHRQQEFHAARWLLLHAVFGLLYTITFGILIWQLNQGLLTTGTFLVLVWFFWGLRGDLNSLAENLKVYTELGGYIDQIDEVINVQGPVEHVRKMEDPRMIVKVKNMQFSYPGTKTTIEVPEFTLYRGEIVCVLGTSGQGKSTLLHLISGLIQHTKGTIDRGLALTDFGMVSQEIELFNTSLRENLTLGLDISDNKLLRVLEELDLLRVVESHPEGLDVVIGEKGLRLSAGQKQRVNIARVLIQDTSVILLDEPISHLDPKTSIKVMKYLERKLQGKTAIIVSHQPQILQLATRTYEMRKHKLGEIVRMYTV